MEQPQYGIRAEIESIAKESYPYARIIQKSLGVSGYPGPMEEVRNTWYHSYFAAHV
jgi:hypothetical protein